MDLKDFLTETNDEKKTAFLQEVGLYVDKIQQLLTFCDNKNCAWAIKTLSKKEKIARFLQKNETFNDFITQNALSQDEKIRKFTYVTAGNVINERCLAVLQEASQTESIYYCFPSIMLSLANHKDFSNITLLFRRCEKAFLNGSVPEKLFRETSETYELIFPKTTYPCVCPEIKKEDKILLSSQKSYYDLMIKSLLGKVEKDKLGVILTNLSTADFEKISTRKDYYELFFYYGKNDVADEQFLSGGIEYFKDIIRRSSNKPTGYRIDVKCEPKSKAKILSTVKKLTARETLLVNKPSDYSFTFCVCGDGKRLPYYILIRPDFLINDRFTYRKNCLPASINPTTANIIAKIAEHFNPSPKKVCDCFCGTATMLIERAFYSPNSRFFASDINPKAIDMARENCALAKIEADFSVKDVSRLTGNYDEIISNLPYGLRVGSHENNYEIYSSLCKKCKRLLSENGYAFLYTADKSLLKKHIRLNNLTLVKEIPMESGGLYCSLFVIRKGE